MARTCSHNLRIVYAGGFEGVGDHPIHRHENAWELVYLRSGRIVERSGDIEIEMEPGQFVVHPPGTPHGDLTDAGYALYHVLLAADQPLEWPRSGRDLGGEPIGTLLAMVVGEWYNSFPYRETLLRHASSMLDVLMRRCACYSSESDVALAAVTHVKGVFRREFYNSIDLKVVANDLGISRSTLYAYFRQVLGRTPQEVLDGIRLKHAVYLLKHSELPIGEIAKGSGYCSASHLGRKIRSTFGVTATEIRDSIL